MMLSAGVTVGAAMYLCLKSTVSEPCTALVLGCQPLKYLQCSRDVPM